MDKSIIYKLIIDDKIEEIKNMLNKDKTNLYIRGPNEQFPIHDACFYGKKDVISLFLKYDPGFLNAVDKKFNNCYNLLARYNPDLLVFFIKDYKPTNINLVNNDGHNTLVSYIIYNKIDEKILKILKSNGSSLDTDNSNGLYYIINKNKCQELDIIKKYFKLNMNKLNEGIPISYSTLNLNNLECLKYLIDNGLNININDRALDNLISRSIIDKNYNYLDFLIKQKNMDYRWVMK